MRSRDLPSTRTLHFAHPTSTTWQDVGVGLLYDTPECRLTSWGHRLSVDRRPAPEDLPDLFALWHAHHGEHGLSTAYVVWEERAGEPLVDLSSPVTQQWFQVLMIDRALAPPAGPLPVRPLADDELELAVGCMTLGVGDDAADDVDYHRWFLGGLMARGTLWGALDGAALVGLAALLTDGREARLQSVATVPEWRGRGVASAVVGAAVAAWQQDHAGIVYVAAEPGSTAEGLYQRLGFRGVTREWVLSRPAATQRPVTGPGVS